MSLSDITERHKNAALKHQYAFSKTFGVSLKKFWEGPILHFDIVAFDEWLDTPDGVSTSDFLTQKYGVDACRMIRELIVGAEEAS